MRRREFISLLGGAAAAWPFAARAQQPAMPVVGFLSVRSAEDAANDVAAFRSGLRESGYVDGQNVQIKFGWGEGIYDRLQAHADDFVRSQVSVIVGFGPVPALAAKSRTTTIPIVFTSSADPIKSGLVASLNRPGGNVTGVSLLAVDLGLKRLELLHQLLPKAELIGLMVNPSYTDAEAESKELQEAAGKLGLQVRVLKVGSEGEIDIAFTTLAQQGINALMIPGDAFFNRSRIRIVRLAAQHRIPATYPWREYVTAGGLLSYGPSISDGFRQAGIYAGKILNGIKPADLPVMQPTKFELAINLKTAKALSLTVPTALLTSADEVIE